MRAMHARGSARDLACVEIALRANFEAHAMIVTLTANQ
jgi:hypothetical protein